MKNKLYLRLIIPLAILVILVMWVRWEREYMANEYYPKVDTTSWVTNHSEIPEMSYEDRMFKIRLLKIDYDADIRDGDLCFTTACNLALLGDLNGSLKWERDMIKYHAHRRKMEDSIKMYFHPQIDTSK